jgi:DNA-directed RNA polymerase subunit L
MISGPSADNLKLLQIAVEQDTDVQEILAEALNMLFERYGKATRADVTSGRRRKTTT